MSVNTNLKSEAIALLQDLIATPSFSREEAQTAELIAAFFKRKGITMERSKHNLWARSKNWKADAPTILLNSHHDTVKPVSGCLLYTSPSPRDS